MSVKVPYDSEGAGETARMRVARCLIFDRTLRLLPYFMCVNSEGSGETAQM